LCTRYATRIKLSDCTSLITLKDAFADMALSINEETFVSWSKGPSATETTKCENAERVICDALNADIRLADLNIQVFTQGSYRARTNVRLDSDVDICILAKDYYFCDYPTGVVNADVGLISSKFKYSDFKNEVNDALIRKFGTTGVTRGNKAFDVHANSYRIDADVVPAFVHRRYRRRSDGSLYFYEGVEIHPDKGRSIINWPEQTYTNGISRNNETSRRYKRIIRILKRLRNRMQIENISAADNIASFLIECLVWNTPTDAFISSSYTDNIRFVLAHTFNGTLTDERSKEWVEVNQLKYLFRPQQPWTREQAHTFLSAAWEYIGFK